MQQDIFIGKRRCTLRSLFIPHTRLNMVNFKSTNGEKIGPEFLPTQRAAITLGISTHSDIISYKLYRWILRESLSLEGLYSLESQASCYNSRILTRTDSDTKSSQVLLHSHRVTNRWVNCYVESKTVQMKRSVCRWVWRSYNEFIMKPAAALFPSMVESSLTTVRRMTCVAL